MKAFVVLFATLCCGLVASAQEAPKIRLEPFLRQVEAPIEVVSDRSSDRLFVIEQRGRIRTVKDGAFIEQPFLDIRKEVDFGGEKGLLGLAFHPDFAKNGYFYVDFTADRPNLKTIIAEFHVEPGADTVDPATERVLLTIDQPYPNHNGGQLQFGPDGMLYIGMGDGGLHDDPKKSGQNLNSLLGKILRIDVNNRDPYGIPKDNPFVGRDDAKPEIWCYGIRNAWRFSFDRKTGDCWCGDIGQNDWEEIDLIVKGGNYGWRAREGFHANPNLKVPEPTPENAIDPVVEYPHKNAHEDPRDRDLSVTGGYVYRGTKFPSLVGWYLYADYSTGRIWGLKYEKGKVIQNVEILHQDCSPSSFGEDKDGELYLCDYAHGKIWKVVGE